MRVLAITPEVSALIKEQIKYAEDHRLTIDQLKLMMSNDLHPIGDTVEHVLDIPDGFRVVYSIDEQPSGLMRHISISIPISDKGPHPAAINMIIHEYGFKGNALEKDSNLHCYIEDIPDNRRIAINVMQLYKDGVCETESEDVKDENKP